MPRFKIAEVSVHADNKTYEGPAFNVIVANCQYYGGGMKISPRSFPGDGSLDVLVLQGPKSDAFTMLPKVYRGEHLPHPHIVELRARREIRVDADRPLPIEADGEQLQIISEQCPFGEAAQQFPHVVCAVDRGMIRGMLAALYGETNPQFAASRPAGTTVRPPGLRRSLAILATTLHEATPSAQVRLDAPRTAA